MALPLAIAAAAPALFKLGTGIVQGIRANKLKQEDFQYIPPALRENLASQRNRARSARIPGQSLAESNIRQSTANAMNAAGAGSLADKIAAAQGLVAQEQNALAGVGEQAAQFQIGEERALQGLMQDQARIQAQNQQRFEQTKLGLKDASLRNMFGGVSDLGSTITGGAFSGLFGGGGSNAGGTTPPTVDTSVPNNYLAGIASQFDARHKPGQFLGRNGNTANSTNPMLRLRPFQAGTFNSFNNYLNG